VSHTKHQWSCSNNTTTSNWPKSMIPFYPLSSMLLLCRKLCCFQCNQVHQL
jgi:hypothetical protein